MQPFNRSFIIAACLAASVNCHKDANPVVADGGGTNPDRDAQTTVQAHAGGQADPQPDSGPTPDSGTDSATSNLDASHDASPAQDGAQTDAAPADAATQDAMQPATGSSMIVGVGSWGLRSRSPDGGPFVVCRNPMTSSDHSPDLLRDVGYGDGVFIAVGGDMNAMVMRSLDAVHWQEDLHPIAGCTDSYPSSCTNWMGAVAYHDGVWLAGGGNGALMRSTDGGLTWSGVHPKSTPDPIRHMAGGSGRFVAGADHGAVFVTADKGDSWTRFDLWTGHQQAEGMRVAHGAGSFIAWGSWYNSSSAKTEQSCFVSADKGDHWQACDASVATSNSFVHDGTRWVTRAGSGYATSTDGVSWVAHAASGVPSELLFDGKTWFGRSGTTFSRGDSPDAFKVLTGTKASDFRSWTIGLVLDSSLPVMGVPACTDKG
jgi:hypothetical protein